MLGDAHVRHRFRCGKTLLDAGLLHDVVQVA